MRLAVKMAIFTTLLIAVVLAAGSTVTINQNFNRSLETAVSQSFNQLSTERYTLENSMQTQMLLGGNSYSEEKLAELASRIAMYSGSQPKNLGVFSSEEKAVYNNLPVSLPTKDISLSIRRRSDSYLIRSIGETEYLILSTALTISGNEAYLTCAYDISGIFNDRGRQLKNQLLLNGILLAVSFLATSALSLFITAPIKRLRAASRKIAAGAYTERTSIQSADEIGELSEQFDLMAGAVENKIAELGDEIHRRDDFVAAFSHEIKTPMTSIMGYADMLRLSPCSHEQQLQYSGIIYREGKRLEALSQKLMEVMLLTGEEPEWEPVDIASLMRQLSKQMVPVLEPVTLSINAENACVRSQSALLDCLLRNLITNALRAEPADGQIRVAGKRLSGGKYRLSVKDTGRGIPAGDIRHITDAFYMVDKSRARANGGAGIGLFLCKKIAEIHGTQMHFESQVSQGTTVWFELEVTADERPGKQEEK